MISTYPALLMKLFLGVLALVMSPDVMGPVTFPPQLPAYWQSISLAQAKRLGQPRLQPRQYRVIRLDLPFLRRLLATSPVDGTAGPVVALPLPNGSLAAFQMRLTTVMAPALAARYPELCTYAGVEVGQPANDVRLEITPAGLRAMLIRQGHTLLIEPYRQGDTQHYICFDKASLPAASKHGFEGP
jgi:hypothetical protein